MCGFAGFINNDKISDPEKTIKEMSKTIIPRGPDDLGLWSDQNKDIFLCFRRLSILDLSEHGHQPMVSRSNRYVICFNGEIYNHQDIRKDINKSEFIVSWNGSSDTETLLAAIEAYGFTEALKKCIGMFAIALYDKKERKLYLARDRFGEKPLYYGITSKSFLFGSDLAALKKHPYFGNKISHQPGEVLEIDQSSLSITRSHYWDLLEEYSASKKNPFKNFNDGLASLEMALSNSIKRQMISDVPLGAFLSGGIDSSLIVAMMQSQSSMPIKTFTIGFNDKSYDESPFAAKVASFLETDHTEVILSPQDAIDIIPALPSVYSEPFADSSQIPTFLVSKLAKSNVTVALSGDAGDEMFAGYNRYFWSESIWKYLSWMPFILRKYIGKTFSSIPKSFTNTAENLLNLGMKESGVNLLGDKLKKIGNRLEYVNDDLMLYNSLCTEWYDNSFLFNDVVSMDLNSQLNLSFIDAFSNVENMMLNDINTYLKEDILTKVDRAAMANSLETRAPFLDHTVAEVAWRFPDKMLFQNTKGKLPLRSLLAKHIPQDLFDRPKSGFGIPLGSWLSEELNDWSEDLLSVDSISDSGLLNAKEVRKIWVDHKNNIFDNTTKIWNILMFISWFRNIKN